LRFVCIAAALVVAACGGDPAPSGRVEISPAAVRLAVGSSLTLAAQALDGAGKPIAGAVIAWKTSDAAVATVSANGIVSGNAAGIVEIQASTETATAKATVTVAPAALINIHTASHVLAVGGEELFSGEVLDATNQALVATLAWSSTDPAVATVTPDGTVVARAGGISTLNVTTPGASAQIRIAAQAPLRAHIAFVSEREPPYGDVVLRPDGGVYLMKSDGTDVRRHIAYSKLGCSPDRPGSPPLCPFPVNQPAIAADGLRIAVVARVHWDIEYTDTVIQLCATAESLCQRLDYPRQTRPPGPIVTLHGVQAPAWSPDGKKVVFARNFGGIVVWDLASGTYVEIGSGVFTGEPAWSPDGQRIAFVAGETGSRAVWLMNPDGGELVRISGAASNDSGPAWSPDGRRIVFARVEGGNSDVYVMNVDGTGVVNLTHNLAQDRNPAWSPDGSRIAFDTDRDGNLEIYLMDPDGENLVNLTQHPASDFSPSWSP
jgi:hypothetical protein